jgi:hypothetical protein
VNVRGAPGWGVYLFVAGVFGCAHLATQDQECLTSLGEEDFWQVDRVESSWAVFMGPRGAIRHVPVACLSYVREGMVFRNGAREPAEERRLALRVRGLLSRLKSRQNRVVSETRFFIKPRPP